MSQPKSIRCINIDWLEVFAREPTNEPHDFLYYVNKGYYVEQREYGTRIYNEMFTVHVYGMPFIEVRRNPKGSNGTGIHDQNETHLRLVNRACYMEGAAILMKTFLEEHNYQDVRLKRIDICYDFSVFDTGDLPATFVQRYFKHRYAKINQSNIRGYGADKWDGQTWNSVSWGSPQSQVYTKLYNKSMELYDIKKGSFKKPYILQAWLASGIIDNMFTCTLQGQTIDVWRLEFTIQSPRANWATINLDGKNNSYQSLKNNLDVYANRASIFVMFASLVRHYFRFKYFEEGVRKDRCKDKELFIFNEVETFYKLNNKNTICKDDKANSQWDKLYSLLTDYQKTHYGFELQQSCDYLKDDIVYTKMRGLLVNPWSDEELAEFEKFLEDEKYRQSITMEENLNNKKKIMGIKNRVLKDFTQ